MSEVKLMMVGDVHVSDTPPSTRTASYRADILTKLMELRDASMDFDAAVFVGDIFHSKKPAKTSHQTVQAVARILQGFGCPVYIVPGNHDYAGRHVENLSKHPLGTVGLMPNVTIFGTEHHREALIWRNLQKVNPSVGRGSIMVRLWGVREENTLGAFHATPDAGAPGLATIVVAHSAIFPPNEKPGMWEAFDAREVAEKTEAFMVWYGHIHEPHGSYTVERVRGGFVEFVNLGAISRGSLHEEGALTRTPAWGALTLELPELSTDRMTWEIEEMPFECARPASEVFRVEEVTAERERASESAEFAAALSAATIEVFSVETAIQAISQHPDAPQPVKDRAVALIEEVS